MESLIKKGRKSLPVLTRRFFLLTVLLLSVVVLVPASGNTETGVESSGSESSVPFRDDNPRIASTPRGAAAVAAATGIDEGEFSIPSRDPETMWRTDRDFSGAEYLTLGGGCFWCVEAVYDNVPGVIDAVSGYAGGSVPDPKYEEVISGRTGHAEVVRIAYDPEVTDVATLLDVFWRAHDPTTPNRQGNDIGTQYRSIILYENENDGEIALRSMQKMNTFGLYSRPAVTEIESLDEFYPSEEYQQDY
ncbi:MAG: peptide-methionine (S)-S-oxide reductase MsrA, partial [Alkalispirochaeta sp.]